MQQYAVFIPIGCCFGLTAVSSMLFVVLFNAGVRAGKIAFAMRAATGYVGFMSLLLLILGGMAFYHGAHLEVSSLGSQAQYFHSEFNRLTIQCGIMAGLVAIGWFLLYKPYERRLLKSSRIERISFRHPGDIK